MVTWNDLCQQRPDITGPGRQYLYQFGVGLGFLATMRPDGGPRVHPMCPVLVGDRLAALIIPSPKRRDLRRDGRFALHSFPCPDNEDVLYLTGTARPITEPDAAASVLEQFVAERQHLGVTREQVAADQPFEFDITTALLTLTTGHGDWNPTHLVWHAGPA